MTTKINFTTEHQTRLNELLLKLLFGNVVLTALLGTTLNVYQLLNETTINSLQSILVNLKKEIDKLANADSWSLNDYQQRKIADLQEYYETVNLIIGYRKHKSQIENNKQEVNSLKAELRAIESANLTPDEKIKQIKDRIAEKGGTLDE